VTRTITIYVHEDNHFSVIEGDLIAHMLAWDELLGQVAAMTIPDRMKSINGMPYARHVDGVLADMEHRAEVRRRKQEAS